MILACYLCIDGLAALVWSPCLCQLIINSTCRVRCLLKKKVEDGFRWEDGCLLGEWRHEWHSKVIWIYELSRICRWRVRRGLFRLGSGMSSVECPSTGCSCWASALTSDTTSTHVHVQRTARCATCPPPTWRILVINHLDPIYRRCTEVETRNNSSQNWTYTFLLRCKTRVHL